jgi:hypothetical protein
MGRGEYTMGSEVDILWGGGRYTMGRYRYTMGRAVDIPSKGVKIPWVGGSIYHG